MRSFRWSPFLLILLSLSFISCTNIQETGSQTSGFPDRPSDIDLPDTYFAASAPRGPGDLFIGARSLDDDSVIELIIEDVFWFENPDGGQYIQGFTVRLTSPESVELFDSVLHSNLGGELQHLHSGKQDYELGNVWVMFLNDDIGDKSFGESATYSLGEEEMHFDVIHFRVGDIGVQIAQQYPEEGDPVVDIAETAQLLAIKIAEGER